MDFTVKFNIFPTSKVDCSTPSECRIQNGLSTTTCVYYPPIYDGYGNNTNPDRNVTTTHRECLTCGKEWTEKC